MAHASTATLTGKPPLDMTVRLKLSVMMFLQYAIWGAWFVTVMPYMLNTLKYSKATAGSILGTMALGTIFAPMFIGQIADRFFSSERLMAILHIAGAGLLYWMGQIQDPTVFWVVALVYALVYSPTLALSNSIAFTHVPDGGRDFPGLRVLGTVGWIVAGWILGLFLDAGSNQMFLLAASFSLALGVFSLMLPHTPPPGKAGDAIPFLKALGLLKAFNFAVFFGVSFVITIVLAFYYTSTPDYLGVGGVGLGKNDVPKVMSIGQFAELALLPFLPFFLSRWGMKWVLAVGMACWGIRYLLFAVYAQADIAALYALVLLGVALHGACFDFFFAAGFIYVDNTAHLQIRGSAQALFTFLTYGVGMWIGNNLSGVLAGYYTTNVLNPSTGLPSLDDMGNNITSTDWASFWFVPAIGVLICFVVFVLFFRDSVAAKKPLAA